MACNGIKENFSEEVVLSSNLSFSFLNKSKDHCNGEEGSLCDYVICGCVCKLHYTSTKSTVESLHGYALPCCRVKLFLSNIITGMFYIFRGSKVTDDL